MSGACTGFLCHNRYRASIVMGRVGSFALGGALATIAACSGMFIPLLIACGIFFLELLLVILQVRYYSYFFFYFDNYDMYSVDTLSNHCCNYCYTAFASSMSCMNSDYNIYLLSNGW